MKFEMGNTMNKSKALTMALLAFAFAAHAAPVSQTDAKLAAKAWVAREGLLGARMGKNVEKVASIATTNGAVFYAVKMAGAGTVIMSGDTDYAPVIAFTPATNDFSVIDRKSPLWALLNRDVSALSSATRLVASAKASSALAARMSSMATKSASLWGELVAEGGEIEATADPLLKYASPITSGTPGDLRVPALMKTKWSQSNSRGKACWNYYTPNGPNPDAFIPNNTGNAVCGCVATAMAQIMRYHSYPTQTLPTLTRMCYWNDSPMDLTTQGGVYDWDSMTYDPDRTADMTDANYRAIGKLTSDAGISVYMQYTDGESGAYSLDIAPAMKQYWQYGSAYWFCEMEEGITDSNLAEISRRAMYSNFDAGLPVFMGIPGHQIVADGYGFNNGYEYVHLNMGWAGSSDYWYNLPEMTVAHPNFNAVDDLGYNVIPDGGASTVVISGRALDDDGEPFEGAVVSLYRSGTSVLVTQTVSSAHGVWGVAVNAGTYDLVAVTADGYMTGNLEGVQVKTPVTQQVTFTLKELGIKRTVEAVTAVSDIGNSWGNDITLGNPAVRVGSAIYTTLDKAIVAAKEMTDPVIEIIAPAKLKDTATIDFNCTITATNLADAASTPVIREEGATLTVAGGARVLLENIVFSEAGDVPVTVLEGGTAALSGLVGISEIATADAGGIELAGALESAIVVDCAAAKDANQIFGTVTASAGAQSSASKFFNKYDDELGGVVQGASLVWGAAVVDDASAIVKLVQDGVTSHYRSLKTLMKFATNDAEIVVVKNCFLEENLTAEKNIFIHSENGATISVTNSATVSLSADMVVSNITFDCASQSFSSSFITLASGASLTLHEGALLCNGVLDGSTGAIFVNSGATLTMLDGAIVSGFASDSASGGAVSLAGTFNFSGGTISGCSAQSGGAVSATYGSKIYLSGSATTLGNTDAEGNPDNIYLWKDDILELEEDYANVSVSVSLSTSSANEAEAAFGTAPSLPDSEITQISSDVNADIAAEIVDGVLVWYEMPVYIEPFAKIGDVVYGSLADAVEGAEDGDTIEIVSYSASYDTDISIDKKITMMTADENIYLYRAGNCRITVTGTGSLTLTNLTINGGMGYVLAENNPVVYVNGGEFTMDCDAVIGAADDKGNTAAGVVVYNGKFTMKKGSHVLQCYNPDSQSGGGVHVSGESAEFNLAGGAVYYCEAALGGGVALMGKAKMSAGVYGDISDNVGGNLYLSDNVDLTLDTDLEGIVVVTNGFNASTKEFGVVADDYDGTNLAASAACFINEAGTNDLGVVVTNASKRILVWASALTDAGDGTWVYVNDDGETLALYGEIPVPGEDEPEDPVDPPAPPEEDPALPVDIAFKSVSYDSASGSWTLSVTNAVKSCWYSLFGGTALNTNDFTLVERKRAEEDGEIVFTHETSSASYFWSVLAEPSDAHEDE